MDYVHLGTSGLEVSAIILGCMSYGDPGRGSHDWTLGEEEARPFIRRAPRPRRHDVRHRERVLARVERGDRGQGAQ